MRTKISGIREIIKAEKYEVNYVIAGKRYQYRINAASLTEAYNKKLEDIAERRKSVSTLLDHGERLNAGFSDAWERLHADLVADNLPRKTIHHYSKTYNRLFNDFLSKRFPEIISFNQLNLPFFREYKNYYVNELDRPKGWRSELIFVKAIISRLYGLGYCSKELTEALRELKKPHCNKKEYLVIPNTKIKEVLQFIKKERPDYYCLLYFISRTGRRINETTLIERKDVEWKGLKPARINIRAETTKTKQSAPLAKLDQDLEQIVSEAYKTGLKYKEPYLFLNMFGRRCTPDKVRGYLKMASKQILETEVTPHYFRHRFLTECGKANVPIVDVMAISGIKDINVIVNHYSHSTDDGQTKVLEVSKI
ncbi:MAG: site-specific integrase [Candidatus Omnitrophota bacterium]